MTRAEVIEAAGPDANPGLVGGPDPGRCDQFRPQRAPDGLLVMVERGVLTRITVSEGTSIATPSGFRVADPATRILEHYGPQAVATPHYYIDPPARYITVWSQAPPAAEPRGIVYEVGGDGRVMHIHAGGRSIEYVEGCV